MERLLDLWWRCYEYDVAVFSEPWMYIPFLVPVTLYLVFFFLKWMVLTLPVWLPMKIIVSMFRRDCSCESRSCTDGTKASPSTSSEPVPPCVSSLYKHSKVKPASG